MDTKESPEIYDSLDQETLQLWPFSVLHRWKAGGEGEENDSFLTLDKIEKNRILQWIRGGMKEKELFMSFILIAHIISQTCLQKFSKEMNDTIKGKYSQGGGV